ncbi:MAG: VWA domain-containing protein [Acidobacteriota bacterium]
MVRFTSFPRPLLLSLVVLLFTINAFSQNDDVINVDSSIVVMNAAVTDQAGKAVSGLNAKLFHVFEDGTEQTIQSFETEETPFAAVILIDTSGSMEQRLALARAAAIQFLGGLRRNDVAAIYNFDRKVDLVQDFSNTHDMLDRFYDLRADGMTVLNDAICQASEVLSKRPEKRRAIIVLSDGADTQSKNSEDKALRAALAVNATIYSVDMSAPDLKPVEKAANRGALKSFADKTGGKYVETPGGVAMREAFSQIVEELGQQYTLAYEPSNTKKDGKWRAIRLVINRPNLTIRTRKGYNAPKK